MVQWYRYPTHLTGQVWATKEGISRRFLKTLDRIIALSATQVLADSASQRDFLIVENAVSAAKIEVLGHGSISMLMLSGFSLIQNFAKLFANSWFL